MKYFQSLTAFAVTALALSPAAVAAGRQRDFADVAAESDKVLIGTAGLRSSHWGDDGRIYTDVVVSPDVTIKGAEEGAVTVRVLGGTVGDTTMTVSDGPELAEGKRVVLFLRREQDHFTVTDRGAGSVPASSETAQTAVDRAFRSVENRSGKRLDYQRDLAGNILTHQDAATTTTTTQQSTAVQTGCYSVDGAKWGTTSAAYRIGTSIPSTWANSINASATTWSNAGAAFRLVNDQNSTNELSFVDLVAKYGSSYSNTYAVTTTWTNSTTGQISKATIEINTSWQWSTTGEANKADVQNILTHEFGHWMRLLDIYSPSTCSAVTMYGTAPLGETQKRTLEPDDITGFKSLYGAASTTTTVSAPALTSPANGATGVATTPTLSWSAASGATSYDVYFGTSTSPALVGTVSGTSYQPGTLTAGATYYWRVVAKNGSTTASSATWSFVTTSAAGSSGGSALNAPTLLTPANGATIAGSSTGMSWTAVSGATSYDVYVGTSMSPARIGTVSGTSVTVSGFSSGVTYYWKVVARSSTSSSPSSATWWFRAQ